MAARTSSPVSVVFTLPDYSFIVEKLKCLFRGYVDDISIQETVDEVSQDVSRALNLIYDCQYPDSVFYDLVEAKSVDKLSNHLFGKDED